jgi:surface protein
MSYMFYNCDKIKKLNLSKFSTSNVINMSNMFENCKNLNDLDISNFGIKNNIRVRYMFSNCQNILKNKIKAQFLNINNDAFDDNFRTDLNSFNSLCYKEVFYDLNSRDLNEDNFHFENDVKIF